MNCQGKSYTNAENFGSKQAQSSWHRNLVKKNSYASTLNEKSDQWPTLQAKKCFQNNQLNPDISSQNFYSRERKAHLGERKKPNQTDGVNSSDRTFYHGTKYISENNYPQQRSKSTSFKSNQDCIKKYENLNPIQDKKYVRNSKDEDNNGWVTVLKKTNKKEAVLKLQVESHAPTKKKAVHSESREIIPDAEREEKKRVSEQRKQRMKEEKKMKREEKARELREKAKRDTRVNLISQDMIKLFSNQNNINTQGKYNSSQSYHKSLQESIWDYPSLGSQNIILRREIAPSSYTTDGNNLLASTSQSEKMSSNIESPIFATLHTSNLNKTTRSVNQEKRVNETPPKKKVKSKDLINLEIMDLIKEKKVVSKNKAPLSSPKRVHTAEPLKKGKIFEGKKKRLSVLKNNMLREKKRQEQILLTVLNGQTSQTEKNNQSNATGHSEESSADTPNPVCLGENFTKEDLNFKGLSSTEAEEKNMSQESTPSFKNEKLAFEADNSNQLSDLPETLISLKITDDEARRELTRDACNLMNPVHSNKFREYCSHTLSPEIDEVLRELIQPLIMFQRRLYMQDPIKAKMRRRYFCGLREALKRMNLNRVTCLIMAPNLKPSPGPGCIDELVYKVLNKAAECNVPVIFGLSHRELGKLCGIKANASCLSIVNIQGVQDKFEVLMKLVEKAKEQYQKLISKQTMKPFFKNDQVQVKAQ